MMKARLSLFLLAYLATPLYADPTIGLTLSPSDHSVTLPALTLRETTDIQHLIALRIEGAVYGRPPRIPTSGHLRLSHGLRAPLMMRYTGRADSVTGVMLAPLAVLHDCQPHLEIYAPQAQSLRGIYADTGARAEGLSGVISIASANKKPSYGYVLGKDIAKPDDNIALYSVSTGDSSGIDVDWKTIDLQVSNQGDSPIYGLYLGAGQCLASELGGRVFAGNLAYETKRLGRTVGVYAQTGDAIDSISGEIGVAQAGTGTRAVGYLLGSSFLNEGDALGLLNAQTGDSSGFRMDWSRASISAQTLSATSYGMYLDTGKTLPDKLGGRISSSCRKGQAYGISIGEGCTLGRFGGTMQLQHQSDVSYGYAKGIGPAPKGSSVGFLNRTTKDSTGFDIDWQRASIKMGGGRQFSMAIALGKGEGMSSPVAGELSVQSGTGCQSYLINAAEPERIGVIRSPMTLHVQKFKSTCFGYVLGTDIVQPQDSVALYNSTTEDSTGYKLSWSSVKLDVANREGTAIGVYLAPDHHIKSPINGMLRVSGDKQMYGIYTHAPIPHALRGRIELLDSATSRHHKGHVYGYVRGEGIISEGDSVALYNASKGDSSGFSLDWRRIHLYVTSQRNNACAIYLTGDMTLSSAEQPLRGSVIAATREGRALALHLESAAPVHLDVGAQIRAVEQVSDRHIRSSHLVPTHAHYGIAIENPHHDIHLRSESIFSSPATIIDGDLLTADKDILFEQGSYLVDAARIRARAICLTQSRLELKRAPQLHSLRELRFVQTEPYKKPQLIWRGTAPLDLSMLESISIHVPSDTQQIRIADYLSGSIMWPESVEIRCYRPSGKVSRFQWSSKKP